jgi:hypothetical protein
VNPASPPSPDLSAVDRWLDGESNTDESATLEAAVRNDPPLAAYVAERRRFLGQLQSTGAGYRAGLAAQLPAQVEARVRMALRRQQSWARRIPWAHRISWASCAAAATVLLAMSAFLWTQKPEPVEAVPAAILRAVDYATWDATAEPGTCATDDTRASDLVRMGNYQVSECSDDSGEPAARLARVEDLPVVGWAAAHATEEVRGPEIGMTVLKNYVVFDVARGRKREYLAVARSLYDELNSLEPDRASCIVCHNRSREGLDNPHDIVLRRWK